MVDGRKGDMWTIYGRQSQSSDRSIAQQLDIGRRHVAAEGGTVHAVYSDGVSASRYATRSRDDWPKLLADVEHDRTNVVWLWESSRGDRRASSWLAFLEDCREHGVRIWVHTHRMAYDMSVARHWKTLADEGVNSQYSSDETSERTRRDVEDRAFVGRPHGALNYGHRREYKVRPNGEREYLRTVPDETTAPVVADIVARTAAGDPLYMVASDLTRAGRLTPGAWRQRNRGEWDGDPGVWTRTAVRRIATNPIYIGKRVHRGEVVEVRDPDTGEVRLPFPPLVDEATFARAQRQLTEDRPRRPDTTVRHLLSGIPVSGCGGRMYLRPNGRYLCQVDGCTARNGVRLENFVVPRAVAMMAKRQDLMADDDSDPELAAAVAEADTLRRRLESLADDLEIDEVTLARRSRAIRVRLDELDVRVRELRLPVALGRVDGPVAEVWPDLDLATQRALIREAVEIRVYPVGRGKPWRDDAVEVTER